MQRRPYTDGDLVGLQDLMAGWIGTAGRCGYDHIGELPHRIYDNLRGRRPVGELVHVWQDGPAVVAISICLRFGCSFDVFVAPALRGTAAERELLTDAARTTAAATTDTHVSTDVFSCDRTRMAALSALGFVRFRVWDQVRERVLVGADPPAAPAGFVIRAAQPTDADQLAAVRNASFDEDWTGKRYRTEVMAKPGYDPSREIVAVAPDGRVAAFAVYWTDPRNRLGHFEPVGTHRDFRRRGLAAVVMREAMTRMFTAGLTSVSVNHNADNEAAARLYGSLGFTPVYETFGYRRAVAPTDQAGIGTAASA